MTQSRSRRDSEYSIAIHEAAHCVVAYAVGSRMRLHNKVGLSIVPGKSHLGFARWKRTIISHEQNAVISFAGCIAERVAFPDLIANGWGGDAEDIMFSCGFSRILRLPAGCSLVDSFMTSGRAYQQDRLREKMRLEPINDGAAFVDHLQMIHFLCNDPFLEPTFKERAKENDKADFALLQKLATASRSLILENWEQIRRLALEILWRKTMSGAEVHVRLAKPKKKKQLSSAKQLVLRFRCARLTAQMAA